MGFWFLIFYGEKNGKALLYPKGDEGTFNVEIYSKFFNLSMFIPIENLYENLVGLISL